ncbi:hypothetical protein Ddye_029819 [Dipteronia dyeriana]|uniref:Transposase n=1 Tax=Dipteronia dyeriana TaxID=168575 RepID=A0AAD9WLW4_9ROSI|nr:hypothetical protein Ddye_029819 [Dipteronia dyeriana]
MDVVPLPESNPSQILPESTGSSDVFHYSKLKVRQGLVKYIACVELPLSFADNVKFENFIQNYIQPGYVRVLKHIFKSDCIRVFDEMKRNLISDLSNFHGTISFACDLWTSCTAVDYIRVTAYFIDSDWMMQKRILAFRLLEYSLNVVQIFQLVMEILKEFRIVDKFFSLTFDDHAANDNVINMFNNYLQPSHGNQFFHINCVCDTINLIVHDGLKMIKNHIEKISEAVLYIYSSSTRQKEVFDLCGSYGLEGRNFKPDFETSWNSTYRMLQSCSNYNSVITDFYNRVQNDSCLCEEDWEISFGFMEFLEVFYNATMVFSGVYSPTSCAVLCELCDISYVFNKYKDHLRFIDICKMMAEKLRKYLESMPPVLYLAVIIDPRIKLKGLELLLNEISQNLSLPSFTNMNDIKNVLDSSFNAYKSKFASTTKVSVSTSTSRKDGIWSRLAKVREQIYGVRSELEKYLAIDFTISLTLVDLEQFNVLAWWKMHEKGFPVLSILARDLLTLPMSTLVSESVFKTGNHQVLNMERSMLPVEIVESFMH